MTLFIDDEVRRRGFNSTLDYIQDSLTNGMVGVRFFNWKYYQSLFEAGLIEEGMFIRTSDAGMVDGFYEVRSDGNLEGVKLAVHSGSPGIFKPEELLRGERISSGWSIESHSALSHHLRRFRAAHPDER